jgi:flagellar hook-length control protein FliK
MDLNLTTTIMPSASPELPEARGNAKGDDTSALPFDLALQSELQLLAPLLADVPGEKSTEGPETPDLLDALAASDPQQSGRPDVQLAILTTADPAAVPSTPTTPQLILPPLASPLPPPPADQALAASKPTSAAATVATATLAPMATAQHRALEAAPTAVAERTAEKTPARITGVATLAATPAAAVPADKALDVTSPLAALATHAPTPAHPEAPTARPRLPEMSHEAASDKPYERGEPAARTQPASAPAIEVERAPVRVEQPIAADVARPEAPVATAPSANVSSAPAGAFTAPPPVSQFTAPQASAVATAHIPTPLGHAEWAGQLREKIVWLVDRQQQTAEIHIHPAHLGPVEVMLTLNDDRTSIAFVSPHPAVREAIESSFSDLRATLEERGLNLGHASVSADARDAREQLPQNAQPGRRFAGGVAAGVETPVQRTLLQRGLVDTFA